MNNSQTETTTQLREIDSGPKGTLQTLKLMRRLAQSGKLSPIVRRQAMRLTQHLRPKDYAGQVYELHKFVRDDIRYTRDIRGVETVQTPEKTLEFGQGDCDDKSLLVAAMLESIGHPTRFVAMGFNGGQYCHVYVETKIGKKWIGVETTEPVALGWYPPNQKPRMVINN